MQVGTHGQPIGDVEAVVNLGVVFSALHRQIVRVVVIVDPADLVNQACTVLRIIIDVDPSDTHAHVIFWTPIERTFVGQADLLVVIDVVGGLVMHGCVGERTQATGSIAVVGGELLLSHDPPAMFAAVRLVFPARGEWLRLTVGAFVNVVGFGSAVIVAKTVFARQVVDLRRPDQLSGDDHAFGAATAKLEAVTGFQVGRVLLERADLCIELRRDVVFNAQRPLADGPVVPDAADPVTHLRAAERQVLEVAREAVEVFARPETTGFNIQCAVKIFLLGPHLRQAPGLTTAPDFL